MRGKKAKAARRAIVPQGPPKDAIPDGDYRLMVVMVSAELTYFSKRGKPERRIPTQPFPIFGEDFDKPLSEILVAHGVKREAL